jgi:hypothetical protein
MSKKTKWEYSVQWVPHSRLTQVLDEMGAEGWELVSMLPGEAVDLVAIFKRPREQEPEEEEPEKQGAESDLVVSEIWEEIVSSGAEDNPEPTRPDAAVGESARRQDQQEKDRLFREMHRLTGDIENWLEEQDEQ